MLSAMSFALRQDVERSHHVVVLVLDDVAMVDVALRRVHPRGKIELGAMIVNVPGFAFTVSVECPARPDRRGSFDSM